MKRIITMIALLLATMLMLTSCSQKLEGRWNVIGGKDNNGNPIDGSFGFFGEHQVEISFKDNHQFTVIVEGSYTKDYDYEFKDGKITFIDQDEYISFSGNYIGLTETFELKINNNRMIWSLPGTQRVIEFEKE